MGGPGQPMEYMRPPSVAHRSDSVRAEPPRPFRGAGRCCVPYRVREDPRRHTRRGSLPVAPASPLDSHRIASGMRLTRVGSTPARSVDSTLRIVAAVHITLSSDVIRRIPWGCGIYVASGYDNGPPFEWNGGPLTP
ncbi:hypothetical protein VWBp60 [Streptomyces phage VWB]|uniref:Uncharacterized protein n=1 Tax=Streptomyces phage VWB TaxID=10702 RepID=Q6VY89_9CAUD|nr:hypothetical protein VWBp60 [Streptomyces phage VWB]AAR29748.1 hypothetical protein [Streptomyces phage VWB]